MLNDAAFAPARFVPLRRHWKVSGAVPPATTEKSALFPMMTVRLCGWLVMDGGTSTVSVATRLVVEPKELLTTTL